MSGGQRLEVFSGENRANIPVYPLDVFALTEAGEAQIRVPATSLPAEALEILVLLDGKVTVGDLEQRLAPLSADTIRNLIRSLVAGGLLRAATVAETEGLDFSAYFAAPGDIAAPSGGAQASAEKEAAGGASKLERTGYYVSIARQAVRPRTPVPGAPKPALVVEDDPDMAGLVRRLLEQEGFQVSVAGDRAGIVTRLRALPVPDVVILDITLPDANGFDVLQQLKRHPALRSVPVIMLTADAKRESVVRGLAGGADGYITKPFEPAALVNGVKAVLGG
jgi:two-component system, OmpR family, response regulator